MGQVEFIPIRKSQMNYYTNIPLYSQSVKGDFILFKPSGIALNNNRLIKGRYFGLFIHESDKDNALKELHQSFNRDLKKSIDSGKTHEVKRILCDLVEETLSEPRSGMLNQLNETMDVLVAGYSKKPSLLRVLASMASKDYSTSIHSVNVMALVLGYCFYSRLPLENTKNLGLTALLHDVGKTEVPGKILRAPRKLDSEEFSLMKAHTIIGYDILNRHGDFDHTIALGALEHHEKMDGSGYPRGITHPSESSQLLCIIDCYEALTNEDRPYRRANKPFDALTIIKRDSDSGKYHKKLFEKVCYSLV